MKPTKYKAVIFDFDDTLFESHLIKWEHHKFVARTFYNVDLTDEDIKQHWGKPFNDLIQILYKNADTVENMHATLLATKDQFPKKLFDATRHVVDSLLNAGIEVGVVSAAHKLHLVDDFERFGFDLDSFFVMQGSDEVDAHKPDPKVFDKSLATLKKKGINKSEVLYVGDSLDDYFAATNAGIGFIGLTTGIYSYEDFKNAGAGIVLSNIGELLDYIETHGIE